MPKAKRSSNSVIGLLLETLDQAFDQEAWHGTTLRGAIPDPADLRAWRRDVDFLAAEHRKLREVVSNLTPAALQRRSPRGVWTNAEEIHGVAAHDLYHTGQIQLIKRLMK